MMHRCRNVYPIQLSSLCRDSNGGQEDGLKKMLRKVQGALPVIGLISRLTTPEGGVGSDELAYPEYCRMVFEAAPEGFQIAVAELQNKYGKSAQRRFVLLCLWMVKEGCGLCSEKLIVDCARRVRVSYVCFFLCLSIATVCIIPDDCIARNKKQNG